MGLSAREVSLNILYDILINEAFSNISIKKYLDEENLIHMEENLVREIVYGVLENDIYIEYIISKASKIKLKKIHPKILIILKMGIYQLIFMDRIPESAAVNESVNLAKKHGHKGTISFVNGILRNIIRNKEEFIKIEKKNKADYISIKYSHPKWMVERWIKEFGEDFTEDLCKKNNESPELNIRVNTLKTNKEKLKNSLNNYGFKVRDSIYAFDSLIVENPTKITEVLEFKQGHFFIQDESSTLVGQIMNPNQGSTIIDICSAPGGKSTHLGQIMNNKGKILSMDIYQHKLRLVEENAERLGINIIQTAISDGTKMEESLINVGDYVLVDAPCSGLGLIRRKPEIKRNRKEEDIKELVNIQYKILSNAKEYLKVGGILIYSTCTIEKDENSNIINRFLEENKNFRLVSIENRLHNKENIETLKDGYIQLFSHIHNTDGFYIAKLTKER
ncbi:16S rRNA (cytosine(967)-C(5))-methyltransferase RsmB [Tissierella pigra]|uniref:16S rRNA (cytosine(967)-C(5))-methyltransferase n=1 Tax=Tissierella pigra TaxID=2607614 RepID=A0A6N7XRN8_9FIRM|nr:16S rRNA (cytosine(967)-C(5))-methyltransferase RsmB [Tissierella pigra]MBU5426480.1 16S rRNA (cytosine(967)-C(5))-methyltransferase RsmB [Tissierella pigra]MSU00073.1 16S rRNA (cytosine(967)-C(5))-methyltransferase RsmB [Tissierella pigra]